MLGGGFLFASDAVGMRLDGMKFNAQTGEQNGSYLADAVPAINNQEGYFFVGGNLRATNLSSNAVDWTFTGDGHLVTSPIIVNQYVIVGSSTGNVYALDGTNVNIVWQSNVGAAIPSAPGAGSPISLSGLSAGDGMLIIPAGSTVTA